MLVFSNTEFAKSAEFTITRAHSLNIYRFTRQTNKEAIL